MRTRVITIALFLLLALDASACPSCTYDRMLAEHWHIKYVLISLVVPIIVVANRLDIVRFTFVLIPYVGSSYWLHSYLFWHTFPGNTLLAQLAWWIWGLNVVGVSLLYLISVFSFFRRKRERPRAKRFMSIRG